MKAGIIVFPGSNCDADCYHVVSKVQGIPTEYIWHKETRLNNFDFLIIPGGFSYGDYLRCGAIAKFSPIMNEVRSFAQKGGRVIGICNGFQILIESGLLPGTLRPNNNLQFICESVNLLLNENTSPWTQKGKPGKSYQMPIAHNDGNYFIDEDGLKGLQDKNQIVFQYSGPDGRVNTEFNPNGSVANIAGICNEQGNVLGMMPHPERASETELGSVDGKFIFESLL